MAIEHGSFPRYVMTAMVNFIAFYALWEIFVFFLPDENYLAYCCLGHTWFLGSLQAIGLTEFGPLIHTET